jgi:mannose-6-phosphate isomerase-like protein (cupin superfamily)
LSGDFARCAAEDSAWRPDRVTAPDFRMRGQVLSVELRRWARDETVAASGPEEVGAVLEGRFELCCGEERYELEDGQGIVIPPRAARCWRALSESGVLYRVFGPPVPSEGD